MTIDYGRILSDIYFECSGGVFYRPEREDHNKFIQFVKDGHYYIEELHERIEEIQEEHKEEIKGIEEEHSELIKELNEEKKEDEEKIKELYDKIDYLMTIIDFFVKKYPECLAEDYDDMMNNKELVESFKKYFEDKKKEDDD